MNAWNLFYFILFLFWMKMHECMKLFLNVNFFILFFLKNAYVCMKFLIEFSEWKCRFECMKFYFLFFLNDACMKFLIEYEFWKCMFRCVKFDLSFFFSFEWCMHEIFLLNMNFENACLNVWNIIFRSFFFIFVLIFFFWRMHLWMHKTWFFCFILFEECIYIMHEIRFILFNFYFE